MTGSTADEGLVERQCGRERAEAVVSYNCPVVPWRPIRAHWEVGGEVAGEQDRNVQAVEQDE